jgi:hypothetical protein
MSHTQRLCLIAFMALAACGDAPNPTGQRVGDPNAKAAGTGAQVAPPPSFAGLNAGGSTQLVLPPPQAPVADNPGRCNRDVDVVFVLDVTGSMIPPLTTLEREVGLVDAALNAKVLPSSQHYGLVIFCDDTMVMNNGAPYLKIEDVKAELAKQIDLTNNNPARQLDPNGSPNLSWPENGLDALYLAATTFQWRPEATTLRTVIYITDASFWDQHEASSGADSEAPRQGVATDSSMHGYAETVAALRAAKVWVNTFTAMTGGPPDNMTSPPSHGQWRGTSVDVGKGYVEPYKGMPPIAMATGGFALSIDDVFDGKETMAKPINEAIEVHQCAEYPLN